MLMTSQPPLAHPGFHSAFFILCPPHSFSLSSKPLSRLSLIIPASSLTAYHCHPVGPEGLVVNKNILWVVALSPWQSSPRLLRGKTPVPKRLRSGARRLSRCPSTAPTVGRASPARSIWSGTYPNVSTPEHVPEVSNFTDAFGLADTNVKPHRCSLCQLSFARR